MFNRRFRRGLKRSMSGPRRASRRPTRKYNSRRSTTTQKPIKAIRQEVNPIVDPKRPTKTAGTRRPIKAVTQQVDPIVDPKRPVMTARPMPQKFQYDRPMYSEGGSVAKPRSGHTDYRKKGIFK